MNWAMWLAILEEASRSIDAVGEQLEGVEDEAAERLREVRDDHLAEVIDLLRTRVAEQEETDAEIEAADAAEYEASLVVDPEDDPDHDPDEVDDEEA